MVGLIKYNLKLDYKSNLDEHRSGELKNMVYSSIPSLGFICGITVWMIECLLITFYHSSFFLGLGGLWGGEGGSW